MLSLQLPIAARWRLEAHALGRTLPGAGRADDGVSRAHALPYGKHLYSVRRRPTVAGLASSSQILSVTLERPFKGRNPHG